MTEPVTIALTCTSVGYESAMICTICGEILGKSGEIPAFSHSCAVEDIVLATQTADGSIGKRDCPVCGTVFDENAVISRDRILTLPAAIKTVKANAFAGTNAQQIVLPSGIGTVGSRAFANIDHLVIVIFPQGEVTISADAFEGSEAVLSVIAGSAAENWAIQHEVPYEVR